MNTGEGPYRRSVSSLVKEQINLVENDERYLSLAGVKVCFIRTRVHALVVLFPVQVGPL